MGIYSEFKKRDLVAQVTNEKEVEELLNNKKTTFYIGFDPTADSLHVGHFVQIMIAARLQKAGHFPIILFGGGTAMVGDPTGKTDMRPMMSTEEIQHNIECFKKQAEKFIDLSPGKALVLNNADWLMNLNYIEFLRKIGVHFSINRMLAAECYKQRLERGLSFFELNYMIMQSYDFLVLNQKYDCILQLGGDDQWSNIIFGADLIRRVEKKEAYGFTFKLLTTADGKKMGKTEKGAVWLDSNKTSPYEFYQYWRNVNDSDVSKCFKMLTFLPVEQIEEYEKLEGNEMNSAKEILAFEITKLVHGEAEAKKAQATAKAVFGDKKNEDNMPSCVLTLDDEKKIGILEMLTKSSLASSKSEARRLIEQGGISIDGEKITDLNLWVDINRLRKGLVIKKGKKIYKKISVQN